jgi:hypothetical protein
MIVVPNDLVVTLPKPSTVATPGLLLLHTRSQLLLRLFLALIGPTVALN